MKPLKLFGAALLLGAAGLTTISALATDNGSEATALSSLEVNIGGENVITGFSPEVHTYQADATLPAWATFSAAPMSPDATVSISLGGTTLTNHSLSQLSKDTKQAVFNVTNGGVSGSYTVNFAPVSATRTIHFKPTTSWSNATPWVYAYTKSGSQTTEHAGTWPGTEMTSEGNGWYSYILPEETTTSTMLIWSNKSNPPRYPADQEDGVKADFEGREGWYDLSTYTWSTTNPDGPQKPVITVTPNGGKVKENTVITVSIANDATNVAATFAGKGLPLNLEGGSFKAGDYLADGETATMTITATNAQGTTTVSDLSFTRDDTVISTTLTGDWRELSIYQVMVGSFQHSDRGASGYSDMWGPEGHRKNGNLRGIIEALDYIKELGMNAIWMTPIFDSTNGQGGEKLQATGYFCTNYFKIDPKFGTEADFDELVREAHERGIYIILDGVFGHHGGVSQASPNGKWISTQANTQNVRGSESGNIVFPGSLDYFKEVVRYWMERGVDGWRLDQCYQVYQGGHNYWNDLRREVEAVCNERKQRGEQWGTLGYMVGEDWTNAGSITVTQQDGLKSVMDFDGKNNLVSLGYGVGSIGWFLANDAAGRGYRDNGVNPTIFLSNHDTGRVGDGLDINTDSGLKGLMTRHAAVAAYSGPACTYYGDEIGDKCGNGNDDNKARTSGRISGFNTNEQRLHDYVAKLFKARSENPALWRGTVSRQEGTGLEVITKTDAQTGNKVVCIFSQTDQNVSIGGTGEDLLRGGTVNGTVSVSAWEPVFIRMN